MIGGTWSTSLIVGSEEQEPACGRSVAIKPGIASTLALPDGAAVSHCNWVNHPAKRQLKPMLNWLALQGGGVGIVVLCFFLHGAHHRIGQQAYPGKLADDAQAFAEQGQKHSAGEHHRCGV